MPPQVHTNGFPKTTVTPVTEPASTRERILEAAIAVIASGGEAALRVDEVADAAGVTKPSIYHFFHDRDGLIVAAQAEQFRRLMLVGLDEITRRARTAQTREEFESILDYFLDVLAQPDGSRRRALRMQILGSAVSRPELTAQIIDALRTAVESSDEFSATPTERKWKTGDMDVDTISLWWMSIALSMHLFDLVADRRMLKQWREFTRQSLQRAYFGE